jgi:hypothetical protein
MIECVWSVGGIILTRKNGGTRRESCLAATLSTTDLAWAGPGSSPSLRSNRSTVSGLRLTVWAMARPLNKSTAYRLVDLFRETGSVQDRRPCQPLLLTHQALTNVYLRLTVTQNAVRTLSQQTSCSHGRLRRCMDRCVGLAVRVNPKHSKKEE